MLVLVNPSSDHDLPREPQRRGRGTIVWQAHTEGFATIAYRDGRAIAGISGPWSQQYVLIWWQPTRPISEVQVFDSLDEAKRAVALGSTPQAPSHLDALLARLRSERVIPRPSWLARVGRWLRHPIGKTTRAARARRGFDAEETDLSGLNFRAMR
jgi:hypothetical protein